MDRIINICLIYKKTLSIFGAIRLDDTHLTSQQNQRHTRERDVPVPANGLARLKFGVETMTYAPFEVKRFRHSAGRSFVRSAWTRVVRYMSGLLAARRSRREIVRLARNHDCFLKDIGLTRSDVDWALMRHWSEDPSEALADRMQRRRAAARWARTYQASDAAHKS